MEKIDTNTITTILEGQVDTSILTIAEKLNELIDEQEKMWLFVRSMNTDLSKLLED